MADRFDLAVIGMGSAGTAAVEFASSLGLRVAAIERHRLGGHRLWTGSVPVTVLRAAAGFAEAVRNAEHFGVVTSPPRTDLTAVWRRIRTVRHQIAVTDELSNRYRQRGVELFLGAASFIEPNVLEVSTASGGRVLEATVVLVCTGSRPARPALEGSDHAELVTTDRFFDLDEPPMSTVVVGGGHSGVELAQALARLGVATTLIQRAPTIMRHEEPVLVAELERQLAADGVMLHTCTEATGVALEQGVSVVHAKGPGGAVEARGDAVVVTVGRRPESENLGLDAIGVQTADGAVLVDERHRASVKSVYAVGSVAGTDRVRAAGYDAVQAVRDAFLPGRAASAEIVPWCTFTAPELAHAGLTVAEAEARYGDVDVWRRELSTADRSRADGTGGTVIVVTARERLVGAHLLAPGAGDLVHELALAIERRLKLADVAALPHVDTTLSAAVSALASEAAREKAKHYRWLVRRR